MILLNWYLQNSFPSVKVLCVLVTEWTVDILFISLTLFHFGFGRAEKLYINI